MALRRASQSFIHQVRILSGFLGLVWVKEITCRNPLFIKSEFSRARHRLACASFETQSQSFIHQVRILSGDEDCRFILHGEGRNPLFIKSEFSPGIPVTSLQPLTGVAILYSSSQNSLGKKISLQQPRYRVAILYSSSQNSLMGGRK